MKFTAGEGEVVTRSGRMGEVGYSKSQPQESKFDFRAIVGQQFFFFSFLLLLEHFSLSPFPCFFAPYSVFATGGRGGEQLGQKLRKLVKGRICWKSGYCEWQLAVHYSWITATPGWRTGREEDREGGRRRKNGRVYMEGGEKKRAKETRWMEVEVRERESFPVKTSRTVLTILSKIVIVSVGIVIRCSWPWRLSINFLVSFFFLFRLNLSLFFFTLSSSTKIIAKKKKERKNRNYFFEYWV